jgi:hypothetical protein
MTGPEGFVAVAADAIGDVLVSRYRDARGLFRQDHIRAACAAIGMLEREFCDRYVDRQPALCVTTTGVTTWGPWSLDWAFTEAGRSL